MKPVKPDNTLGGSLYVHVHPTKRPERILELWYNEAPIASLEERNKACQSHRQDDELFIQSALISSTGFFEATTGIYCVFTKDTPVKILAGAEGWYQVHFMDHCHWKIGYPGEDNTTTYVKSAPRFIWMENKWCLIRPLCLSPLTRVFMYNDGKYRYFGLGPSDTRFLINPPGHETILLGCDEDILGLRQYILFDNKIIDNRIKVPQRGYPLISIGHTTNWVIRYEHGSLNQTHVPDIKLTYINYTLFKVVGAEARYLDDRNPWYAVVLQWIVETLFGSIGGLIQKLTRSTRFWWSLIMFGLTRHLWKSDILSGVLAIIVMVL